MRADGPAHAVCITGLERSFPEIQRNVHFSLRNLYAPPGTAIAQPLALAHSELPVAHAPRQSVHQLLERRLEAAGAAPSRRKPPRLGQLAAFFGVRPANDSWAALKAGGLPPLTGESVQTPCGEDPEPPWFHAFAKTKVQQHIFRRSFVQVLCDLSACHRMIQEHEARVGRRFETIARLRLDIAWETPLAWPPTPLRPDTVYTVRMNTKAGVNDKWALGLREPMGAYLDRVRLLRTATALYNRSAPVALRLAHGRSAGLASYDCSEGRNNERFVCYPQRRNATTGWQGGDGSPTVPRQRKFVMTSEGFLQWALWRNNVSVGYDPKWMFCKYQVAVGSNKTARTCVPRMRERRACEILVCGSSTIDCVCKEVPCGTSWYCENVRDRQLTIDGVYGAAGHRWAPRNHSHPPRNHSHTLHARRAASGASWPPGMHA